VSHVEQLVVNENSRRSRCTLFDKFGMTVLEIHSLKELERRGDTPVIVLTRGFTHPTCGDSALLVLGEACGDIGVGSGAHNRIGFILCDVMKIE
jgi:hypothetical protein